MLGSDVSISNKGKRRCKRADATRHIAEYSVGGAGQSTRVSSQLSLEMGKFMEEDANWGIKPAIDVDKTEVAGAVARVL